MQLWTFGTKIMFSKKNKKTHTHTTYKNVIYNRFMKASTNREVIKNILTNLTYFSTLFLYGDKCMHFADFAFAILFNYLQ